MFYGFQGHSIEFQGRFRAFQRISKDYRVLSGSFSGDQLGWNVPRVSRGFMCVPRVLKVFQERSGCFEGVSGDFKVLQRI